MSHFHVWRTTLDGKGRKVGDSFGSYHLRTQWITEQAAQKDAKHLMDANDPKIVAFDVRECQEPTCPRV